MKTNRKKANGAKQQAMWLIAHLRAMGVEPVPFNHRGYRSYRADLQRQYDPIHASMARDAASRARIAARAAVRLKSLQGVSGDLLHATANGSTKSDLIGHGSQRDMDCAPVVASLVTSTLAVPRLPTLRDISVCRRKLCHADYLSALSHLVQVGDVGMHAYSCPICLGIHIGHDRDRVQLRVVTEQLVLVSSSLATLGTEKTRLEIHQRSLLAIHQRLVGEPAEDEILEGV